MAFVNKKEVLIKQELYIRIKEPEINLEDEIEVDNLIDEIEGTFCNYLHDYKRISIEIDGDDIYLECMLVSSGYNIYISGNEIEPPENETTCNINFENIDVFITSKITRLLGKITVSLGDMEIEEI